MTNVKIIIASDSVGETAELVAKACMSQFNYSDCSNHILRYPYIETKENIDEVIAVAREVESIIIYTLVKPDIRAHIQENIDKYGLKSVDVMGHSSLYNVYALNIVRQASLMYERYR